MPEQPHEYVRSDVERMVRQYVHSLHWNTTSRPQTILPIATRDEDGRFILSHIATDEPEHYQRCSIQDVEGQWHTVYEKIDMSNLTMQEYTIVPLAPDFPCFPLPGVVESSHLVPR